MQPRTAAWQKQEILSEVTGTFLRTSCGQLEKLPFLRVRQHSERSGFGSRVPPCRWPLPNITAQRLCFEQDCSSAFAGTLWEQHFLLSFNRHNEEAIFLRESNQKTNRMSVMLKVFKKQNKNLEERMMWPQFKHCKYVHIYATYTIKFHFVWCSYYILKRLVSVFTEVKLYLASSAFCLVWLTTARKYKISSLLLSEIIRLP